MKWLLVGLVLAHCAGCTTIGSKFDMAAIDRLQPGVSTISDAVALLGPYSTQAANSSGVRVYGWTYAQGNGLTGKVESQSVMLSFGADGRLMQTSSSSLPGRTR